MPTINCANCGAPLEASASARFVSCRHCGTSLEIKRSDSAEWTETLDKVAAETERLRQDVDAIRIEQEVERLDREWQMRQEQLRERTRRGGSYRPSYLGATASLVGLLVFTIVFLGVFFRSSATGMGLPPFFGLFFIFVIIMALVGVFRTFAKAGTYDAEERAYRQRREALLSRRERS
jgi:hypothetical protein